MRHRAYCPDAVSNIAQLIEDDFPLLDDGFDFELGPNKRFRTWCPQRKVDRTAMITLDGTNVADLDCDEDGRDAASYVTGIGADDCAPILVTVANESRAAAMKRLDGSVDISSADEDEITAAAQEYLRANKKPRLRVTATYHESKGPAWSTLNRSNLGDLVTVTTPDFSLPMRVMEFAVTLQPPNQAFFEVVLDSAVD